MSTHGAFNKRQQFGIFCHLGIIRHVGQGFLHVIKQIYRQATILRFSPYIRTFTENKVFMFREITFQISGNLPGLCLETGTIAHFSNGIQCISGGSGIVHIHIPHSLPFAAVDKRIIHDKLTGLRQPLFPMIPGRVIQ